MVVPANVADETLAAERRRQIVSTASGVMPDKGFHRTSMREIAASGRRYSRRARGVLKQRELRKREFLADIIRSGIDRGEFRPVNPELVAHDIIMLAHMWTLKGWALKDTFDVPSYFRAQFDVILSHVLPEGCDGRGHQSKLLTYRIGAETDV